MKILAHLLLGLTLGGACAYGAGISERSDPRLGAPFAERERARIGSGNARVIVIEFSSFKCRHCQTFHQEIFPALRQRYIDTDRVEWVIINASNNPSDRESPEFTAARLALAQGRYWDELAQLYAAGTGQPGAGQSAKVVAARRGDRALADNQANQAAHDAVGIDFGEYAALGLRGTPTFLLRVRGQDGRWRRGMIEDLHSLEYFEATLDGLLGEP